MIKVRKRCSRRVCQGDILKEIEYIEYVKEDAGEYTVSKIIFPLVIVLSQDCDLEQDYTARKPENLPNQDKWLFSVLVAPVYNADHLFMGTHLEDLQQIMHTKTKNDKNAIKTNQQARYHYLEFPEDTRLPASVIDFKHYFTVNIYDLKKTKKQHYVCQVSDLYREQISHRFAFFLSRIGLPEIIKNSGTTTKSEKQI